MKNIKPDPRAELAMSMPSIIYMNATTKFNTLGVAPKRQAV